LHANDGIFVHPLHVLFDFIYNFLRKSKFENDIHTDSYLFKDKLRIKYLKKSTIPVYRAAKCLADDLIFDIVVEKTPDSWSSSV